MFKIHILLLPINYKIDSDRIDILLIWYKKKNSDEQNIMQNSPL